MTLTELIANALPNLPHPGDDTHPPKTLTLPIFQPQTLPPEMAAKFAEQANLPSSDVTRLVAEALVALITTDHDVLTKTEAAQLGTITVTARKREETLQEVPIAVTAFSEQKLEDFNVEDLSDLDSQVPNLTVYAARGSSSTITAYIRGVGQADPLWGVDPGVGIYLDDVYIARPQGALLDVFDVERIEVLRGPQGSLYGKNTVGGAIKYVSRPLEDTFGGRASFTAGSYNQQDLKLGLNVPLGESGWVLRAAGANLTRDGYGENRRTGQDVSDKEMVAGRFTLGYTGSDVWSMQLTADHIDDASAVRGARMLGAYPVVPLAKDEVWAKQFDLNAGARFTEQLHTESARMEDMAAQLSGSAADVASLGEAFTTAVGLFTQASEQAVAQRGGGAFADLIVGSYDELSVFALVLGVLGGMAERCEGIDDRTGADGGRSGYGDVGDQAHALVQLSPA